MEKITYKTNDPKGWMGDPKRGAALGRPSIQEAPYDEPIRLYLSRVCLDSGGYDCNGTYFGLGEDLYWVHSSDGSVDYMVRAESRKHAKRLVTELYPNATFFR